MLLIAKVDQRVEAVGAFDHDVAAAPAVAAVRAAELDEFLAPERDRARPAVAGADIDPRLVEKLHRRQPITTRAPGRPRRAALAPDSAQSVRERRKLWHSTMPPRAGAPLSPVPTNANPPFSSTAREASFSIRTLAQNLDHGRQREAGVDHRQSRLGGEALAPVVRAPAHSRASSRSLPRNSRLIEPTASRLPLIGVMTRVRSRPEALASRAA